MKARLQPGDRVLVEPFGVNATIKRIIPVWRYGKTEPVKVILTAVSGEPSTNLN
jgi:hypothetical protein